MEFLSYNICGWSTQAWIEKFHGFKTYLNPLSAKGPLKWSGPFCLCFGWTLLRRRRRTFRVTRSSAFWLEDLLHVTAAGV